jgi:hypothetical protein
MSLFFRYFVSLAASVISARARGRRTCVQLAGERVPRRAATCIVSAPRILIGVLAGEEGCTALRGCMRKEWLYAALRSTRAASGRASISPCSRRPLSRANARVIPTTRCSNHTPAGRCPFRLRGTLLRASRTGSYLPGAAGVSQTD